MIKEKIPPFAQDRDSYVLNLAQPHKKDSILNIGVSNIPRIEMQLENKVSSCTTVDIDEEKVSYAQKFLKKAKLVIDDITSPSKLRKNSFNTIIMLEVLEHLDNDEHILKIINGLLKRGGRLVISVPTDHPLHVINPVKYTQHKRHYSKKRLITILERAGFTIEHFNVVEDWKLLANLYVHLFNKYVRGKKRNFNFFDQGGNRTYGRLNKSGLDFIVSARKVI